jgi:hypothetical protein
MAALYMRLRDERIGIIQCIRTGVCLCMSIWFQNHCKIDYAKDGQTKMTDYSRDELWGQSMYEVLVRPS